MKTFILLTIGFFLTVFSNAEENPSNTQDRWEVNLNSKSLETILLTPEKVLEDPDQFWETDGAYQISSSWHKSTHTPLDNKDYYNRWLGWMQEFAEVPEMERKENEAFGILQEVKNRVEIFENNSIPLLNAFLPENELTFQTNAYFTTKTYAFAFMSSGMIVIDVLSPYFEKSPDKIFNLVTHECFHIGYGFNRYLRREAELKNSFIYNTMLDGLQNEGMATYLGYLARDFFPVEGDRDYTKLEEPDEVKRLFAEVNKLFAAAESLNQDSLRTLAWNLCVDERGYYIVGATMAKKIDEKLGRQALIETISNGPLHFIEVYNSLNCNFGTVYNFKSSDTSNWLTDLKTALLNNQLSDFETHAKQIKENTSSIPKTAENQLTKLGYGMLYVKYFEKALLVFQLNTELFPRSANTWDCLAEAYLRSGDKENAIRYYQKALDVDPEFHNAKKMLAEING